MRRRRPLYGNGARWALMTGGAAAVAAILTTAVAAAEPAPAGSPPQAGPGSPIAGTTSACDDFRVALLPFGLLSFDVADEGWVWVDRARRFRSASGLVVKSHVASNDTPANHDSHDHNTVVLVDPGQEDILSVAGNNQEDDPRLPPDQEREVDALEIEWEIGTRPSEHTGDGAHPTFPKWVWPSVGDRVWSEGNWVFDCGHPTEEIVGYETVAGIQVPIIVKHYRTELHPARAMATMRDQAHPLPGSGGVAVPVTATDLFIHGRGGFVVDQLNCGMGIIIDGVDGGGDPDACEVKTSPIDTDFAFDVCLPPSPAGGATVAWSVEAGPGNTVDIAPQLTPIPAAGACLLGDQFDHGQMLHAVVPLGDSGVAPESVYARRIDAGWVGGVQPAVRRFEVTLNRMDLHDDHDLDPGDGELTFTWMNVNRARDEWIRLSDYADGDMNDYDDDNLSGDGFMDFTGASFKFYVRDGQPFTIRAGGYDQDCYDGSFGFHFLTTAMYVICAADLPNAGTSDDLLALPPPQFPDSTTFGPPDYGVGSQDLRAFVRVPNPFSPPEFIDIRAYELEVAIREVFDNTPPTTTATPSPGPNTAGWNNTNVSVAFSAVDNPGGTGVQAIVLHATGAQPFDLEVAGGTAAVDITTEGVTAIAYSARDNEGNEEPVRTLMVQIDRTPPTITGTRTPAANAYGWNNTDVSVTFTCADTISGVASCGPSPQIVTTEGVNQSRSGQAVDLAGNTANATVGGINIDKTPPVLTGLPVNCVLWPPEHQLVPVGTVQASDALSGLVPGSFTVTGASNEPENGIGDGDTSPDIIVTGASVQFRAERSGTGTGRVYSLAATAQDLAGNVANATAACTVPLGR